MQHVHDFLVVTYGNEDRSLTELHNYNIYLLCALPQQQLQTPNTQIKTVRSDKL